MKSTATTAILPNSSVECQISLFPHAISGIFFQLQSENFTFHVLLVMGTRKITETSQGFEGGNECWEIPQEDPCPPRILLIWKNKGKQHRGVGSTFLGFKSDASTVHKVLEGCYLRLPCQTWEGKGPQRIHLTDRNGSWCYSPLNKCLWLVLSV